VLTAYVCLFLFPRRFARSYDTVLASDPNPDKKVLLIRRPYTYSVPFGFDLSQVIVSCFRSPSSELPCLPQLISRFPLSWPPIRAKIVTRFIALPSPSLLRRLASFQFSFPRTSLGIFLSSSEPRIRDRGLFFCESVLEPDPPFSPVKTPFYRCLWKRIRKHFFFIILLQVILWPTPVFLQSPAVQPVLFYPAPS